MGSQQPQMIGVSGLSSHQAGMFQAPYHAVPSRPWVSTVPSGGSGSGDPPPASTQESVQASLSSSDSQVSVTPKAAKKRHAKVKSTKKKTPARKAKACKKTPAASTCSKAKK
jgi:hypothetical protein